MRELALSTCKYGCKVYTCPCGNVLIFHSKTYGHPQGSVQRSSTGARCDCGQ